MKITDNTIRLLKKHYYGNIAALAVVFVLVMILAREREAVSVALERYALMVSIIAIPASLKFFAHRLKRLPRPLETAAAAEKYGRAWFLRLYALSGVTLGNIVLFGVSRNMNFFWFTVVLFVVFMFCKPSHEELKGLAEQPKEEER
jgi:cobalamin synthase